MKNFVKTFLIEDEAQAIVEYMLLLMIIVTGVTIMTNSFRTTVRKLWVVITKEVIAACPGCPSPDSRVK